MDSLPSIGDGESPSDRQLWHKGTFKLFLTLIVTVTLIPLVAIAILGHFHPMIISNNKLALIIALIAGPGHVGLTSFFYADKEMKQFFVSHPVRYIIVPIVLAIAMGLYFQFLSGIYTANLIGLFLIWQTYHYQRQNYGILSFFNAATGGTTITRLEKIIVELSAIAGILGLFQKSNLFNGTLLVPYMQPLYQAGLFLNCLVLALLGGAILAVPAIRNNRPRCLFLSVCALFYLPTFLVNDPGAAIASYAFAHGFQYYVFMYFIAANSRRRQNRDRMTLLICSAVAGILILTLFPYTKLWGNISGFVFGIYLSMVMSHFVIDAGIWRIRSGFQRSYMGAAFPFVFKSQQITHTQFKNES